MASTKSNKVFSTIISTKDGFKAANPASKHTFTLLSASLLIGKPDELAGIMGQYGVMDEHGNVPQDFKTAEQLFIQSLHLLSEMEEEQLALAPEARRQDYIDWKQTTDKIRNLAEITVILRGEIVKEEGPIQRVTCYVNPERSFTDGNVAKAGRFNTRTLFTKDVEISAFGTMKVDARRGLVINAFGVGPQRDENDPVVVARTAHRAAINAPQDTPQETVIPEEMVADL